MVLSDDPATDHRCVARHRGRDDHVPSSEDVSGDEITIEMTPGRLVGGVAR